MSSASAPQPEGRTPHRFPVSVKGIISHDGKVVLLKNERDEWELPGGKLELGEAPEACVVREIEEEIGFVAEVSTLIDAWVYHIFEGRDVFILTYGCTIALPFSQMTHGPEHKAGGLFLPEEIPSLRMPEGYKRSIASWLRLLQHA